MSTQHVQDYIGKRVVKDDEEVSNSDNVVRESQLPGGTRVLRPDSVATMDYREDRLNLHVDDKNVVVKQRLG